MAFVIRDGVGPFTDFFWVTLPLPLPSIVVAALVAFLVGYTEFAIGWLFVESSENVTAVSPASNNRAGQERSLQLWPSR
jgi:ABC-type maltose transport system permease subunit